MSVRWVASFVVCLVPVVGACAGSRGFDSERALGAESLEVQLDEAGDPIGIDYRIPPTQVPDAVRAAMDYLHPGGDYVAAEVHFHAGKVRFELSRLVDGRMASALFQPDGKLVSEEVEVDPRTVPTPVHETARRSFPRGRSFRFSVLRNASQELVDYNVRLVQDGLSYKAALYANGHLHAVWRQISSEIEVPMQLR